MLFGQAGSYYNWILSVLFTAFASSGIGYIAGAYFRSHSNASVFTIIISFVFSVFSGTSPTLAQVNRIPVVNWLWQISFSTWSAEAVYITWSRYLSDWPNYPIQEGADHFGYDISHGFTRSISILVAIGIVMRIIAVIILIVKSK